MNLTINIPLLNILCQLPFALMIVFSKTEPPWPLKHSNDLTVAVPFFFFFFFFFFFQYLFFLSYISHPLHHSNLNNSHMVLISIPEKPNTFASRSFCACCSPCLKQTQFHFLVTSPSLAQLRPAHSYFLLSLKCCFFKETFLKYLS